MFQVKRLASLLLLLALVCAPGFAAFNAGSIWRVATVSSADTNGGAFDPSVGSPGTDESTGAGTAVTITLTAATTGTMSPAISSTTHGPGNFVNIASGSGCTTGIFELKSQAAGVGTFDHTMGSSTNVCVGVMGGPLLTIGTANTNAVANNHICVKADGTYSISSNISVGVSGLEFQGYTTTCGVSGSAGDGGKATIQASAAVSGMFTIAQANTAIRNFTLDCNSQAGTVRGVNITSQGGILKNLLIENCATAGIASAAGGVSVYNVRVTASLSGCTAGFVNTNSAFINVAVFDTNQCHGLTSSFNLYCNICISANNTGTSDGFNLTGGNNSTFIISNSIGYGNGRDGINFTAAGVLVSSTTCSFFYGNTTKDMASTTVPLTGLNFDYNGYRSGSLTNITAGANDVILSADPTVAGASLNFALNSTAGGGASLKNVCFPGALTTGGTGYSDIGALHHQDPAGGGGTVGYPVQ